jgi:peptidoglycan/LPS O-acetylase OafA/YrhL
VKELRVYGDATRSVPPLIPIDIEVPMTGKVDAPDNSPRGAEKADQHYRPDIEGLRAVAVVAVVLFHAGVMFLPGGFVGVDVFFVISGFLITGMLWRETGRTGTVSLRRFWAARARRLLPASVLVGIITAVASAMLLPPLQSKTVSIDAITSALYVSNYWFAFTGVNYFGRENLLAPSPFQHYWSLGVEEQFYLVWPLLILFTAWVIRRFRRGRVDGPTSPMPYLAVLALIAAVSFFLSVALTYVLPPFAYFSLPTRAWQLALGGIVAFTAPWWRKLPVAPAAMVGWCGLGLIVAAYVLIDGTSPYPGVVAALPTAGAALVIAAGCAASSSGAGALLGTAPMRAIGRVSYSWYLWHWPVLVLVPAALGHRLGVGATVAAVALSLALAILTMRYVENPVRFSPTLRDSPSRSLTMGGVTTAAAVIAGVVTLVAVQTPSGRGPDATPLTVTAFPVPAGSPIQDFDAAVQNTFDQVQAAVSASLSMTAVPPNLTPALTGQAAEVASMQSGGCLRVVPFDSSPHPDCVTGDPNSPVTVALVGDSQSAMFNPAFEAVTAERGWRLLRMAKVACPIVELPSAKHFDGVAEALSRCAHWRAGIMDRLRAERPSLVVVSSARVYGNDGLGIWGQTGFNNFDAGWVGGLGRFTAQMRALGSQVLVLGPTPGSSGLVPVCLSAHINDPLACSFPVPRWASPAGIAAERAAVEGNGGQYADITELFCARGQCPVIVGNVMVFYDSGHLSREYSRTLAPVMGALSDRALALR